MPPELIKPSIPCIFEIKSIRLSLLFYNLSILLYAAGIHVALFIWNKKAGKWVKGRKKFPELHFTKKTIWVHCASLGEFEQGRPALEALKLEFPGYPGRLSFFSGLKSGKIIPVQMRSFTSLRIHHPMHVNW